MSGHTQLSLISDPSFISDAGILECRFAPLWRAPEYPEKKRVVRH